MARTKAKSDDIDISATKMFAELEEKTQCHLKLELGGSYLSLQKSLFMTYAFVHQLSYADTVRETSIDISEDGTHFLAKTIAENCAIK